MPPSSATVPAARSARLGWLLYDFANNSFSVMIVTFVFPVYFKGVVCAGLGNLGDLLWGAASSISLVVVALLSPVLGAAADLSGRRKGFLIAAALVCIVFTAQLAWLQSGMVVLAMALFIAANIAFQTGQVFYNAYLPDLAAPEEVGRLSGYGWAAAYLGGIAALVISIPLLQSGAPDAARRVFVFTALFYLVFALPAFYLLPRVPTARAAETPWRLILAGLRQVKSTLGRIGEYRTLARFLLAYFVYMEGVSTISYYASIYAQDTLGFTMPELVRFYLVLQTIGVAGAIGFGYLSDRVGPRRTLVLLLMLWTVVGFGAAAATSKAVFWLVSSLGALCLASVGAVSRSMLALLVHPSQQAEIFGFYGISGKFSSAVGPLLFGVTSHLSGSQRIAMSVIGLLFIVGLALLVRVEEPARKAAW